jgi:hypothetical protein
MKKTKKLISVFLLIIIFLALFNTIAIAAENNNEEKIKYPYLFPAKVISELTNTIFNHYKDNIEQENASSVLNVEMNIFIEIGKKLLVLFFVAGFFIELDRIGEFNIYTFLRMLVVFVLAYIAIDYYYYLFAWSENFMDLLISHISISPNDKIIEFDYVVKQFELALSNEEVVDNMLLVYTTIVYTLMTYSIFISIILIYVILVIRQFKLFVLQLLAPVMLSGLGSIHTISFTTKYIKKYIKVYFQLFFIQYALGIYLALSIASINLLFVLLQAGLLIVTLVLGEKLIGFSFNNIKNGVILFKKKTEQTIKYIRHKTIKKN